MKKVPSLNPSHLPATTPTHYSLCSSDSGISVNPVRQDNCLLRSLLLQSDNKKVAPMDSSTKKPSRKKGAANKKSKLHKNKLSSGALNIKVEETESIQPDKDLLIEDTADMVHLLSTLFGAVKEEENKIDTLEVQNEDVISQYCNGDVINSPLQEFEQNFNLLNFTDNIPDPHEMSETFERLELVDPVLEDIPLVQEQDASAARGMKPLEDLMQVLDKRFSVGAKVQPQDENLIKSQPSLPLVMEHMIEAQKATSQHFIIEHFKNTDPEYGHKLEQLQELKQKSKELDQLVQNRFRSLCWLKTLHAELRQAKFPHHTG